MEECYCLGIITDRDGPTKKQTDQNQPSDGHEGKLPLAPPKSQWIKCFAKNRYCFIHILGKEAGPRENYVYTYLGRFYHDSCEFIVRKGASKHSIS